MPHMVSTKSRRATLFQRRVIGFSKENPYKARRISQLLRKEAPDLPDNPDPDWPKWMLSRYGKRSVQPDPESEVQEWLRCLIGLIADSGLSLREVERRLGRGAGYMSRMMSGARYMKLEALLEVLGCVDVHPVEFMEILYPSTNDTRTRKEP